MDQTSHSTLPFSKSFNLRSPLTYPHDLENPEPCSPHHSAMADSFSPKRALTYLLLFLFTVITLSYLPKPAQTTAIYTVGSFAIARSPCAIAARRGVGRPALCTPLGIAVGTAVGTSHVWMSYDDGSLREWAGERWLPC